MKEKIQKNQGMIMLEAVMVLAVSSVLFYMIFTIAFVYYQEWTIKTIANQTATQLAQSYKVPDAGVDGSVTDSILADVGPYRYVWFCGDNLEARNEEKAKNYVTTCFENTSILQLSADPVVDIEVEANSLARRRVVVKISGQYSVPFIQLVLGRDVIDYEVMGIAECVDIIDYMTMVNFVDNITSLDILNSNVLEAVKSVLNTAAHAIKAFGGDEDDEG